MFRAGNPFSFLDTCTRFLRSPDTGTFRRNFINTADIRSAILIGERFYADSSANDTEITFTPMKQYDSLKLQEVYYPFREKLNVTFPAGAVMRPLGYDYHVSNNRQYLLPALSATIYFSVDTMYYKWEMQEAVWVADRWKISTMGEISQLPSGSKFLVDSIGYSPGKLLEVQSITVQSIEADENIVEPPPPPPPKPKVKRKRLK